VKMKSQCTTLVGLMCALYACDWDCGAGGGARGMGSGGCGNVLGPVPVQGFGAHDHGFKNGKTSCLCFANL
jgi:hypothetical protein